MQLKLTLSDFRLLVVGYLFARSRSFITVDFCLLSDADCWLPVVADVRCCYTCWLSYISAVGKHMLSVGVGCRWKFLFSVPSSVQGTTVLVRSQRLDDRLWPASCWFSWRRVLSVLWKKPHRLPRQRLLSYSLLPTPAFWTYYILYSIKHCNGNSVYIFLFWE